MTANQKYQKERAKEMHIWVRFAVLQAKNYYAGHIQHKRLQLI